MFKKQINIDLLILIITKGIQVVLGLFSLRLLTEVLNAQQVGIFYILQTITSLLAFGLLNPLGQYYSRHIVIWNERDKLKTATVTLLLLRAATIPVALLISVAIYHIFNYSQYLGLIPYLTYIIVAMMALTYGVFLSATNILIGRLPFAIYSVVTLLVALLASILFTKLQATALAWAYGTALVQIVFAAHMFRKIVGNQKFQWAIIVKSLRENYHIKVALFIAPVTITLFLQWGQNSLFRMITENIYSIEILAYIGVGVALSSSVFSAAESLANQYYMPNYLREINNANEAKRAVAWNNIAKLLIPIYVALTVYVMLFSSYIAKILLSDNFFSAYHYAVIGAVAELFRVITNLLYLVSQSEINTKKTLLPYVLGVFFLFIILTFLDNEHDPSLVVTTLALVNFITMVFMYTQMKKLLHISIDFNIIKRMCLLLIPLLPVLYLENDKSVLISICLLGIGALYTASILYFCLTQSLTK